MFLSKSERAALALKKRQEEVTAQRKATDEERGQRQKYLEEASMSAGGQLEGRRRWDERDEEKERLREEGITLKDKEKEMEAIKVRRELRWGK